MISRRQVLKSAAAAGVASFAAPYIASAQAKDVLKFVPYVDLGTLDPIQTPAFVTRNHAYMVFDTLYGHDDQLMAQPQMVAGHVVEDDGKIWKLTLREGLKFHDGQKVLARDAVASIRRWGLRDSMGQTLMAATAELSAPSDDVIQFRLHKPFPKLSDALGKCGGGVCFIMPERLTGVPPTTQITEMVGSGPYRFLASERVPGSLNVYEKFDGYVPRPSGTVSYLAGPKVAHFARVEWHTIPDAATAAAALQRGEVDWVEQVSPDLAPLLTRDRDIAVEILDPWGSSDMLRFNHLQPPFDKPEMRRAVLWAISQQDVLTAAAGDSKMWTEAGFFAPKSPLATKVGMEPLLGPRNLDRARRELQAAGYAGERIVFPSPSDSDPVRASAEVLAEALKGCGLNIDYQSMDFNAMIQRAFSKARIDKGGWNIFPMFTLGVSQASPANHSFLRTGPGATAGWPQSERLEELRNAYLGATTTEEERKICEQIQVQAFQDVPYVPLGIFYVNTAYRKSLTGIIKGVPMFYNVRRV